MKVDYIVYSLGAIISYLNIILIYGKIINKKIKFNTLFLLMLVIMGIINGFVIVRLPVAIKPVYNLVCLFILNYLVFKSDYKRILFYILIIWINGCILDIVFMAFFAGGFEYLLKVWPHWGILIISLFLQVILNMVFRIKKYKSLVIKLEKELSLINNIIWLFLIVIFLVVFFTVTAFSNVTTSKNVLTLLLLLFITIFLTSFLLKILYEEKTFKITIENLLNNNKYYLEVNAENRIFKHNIIHRLNSIKSVSTDKTNKLIDDLITDYNVNNLPNRSIDILPNGINGIISRIIYGKKISNLDLAINNYLESDLFDVLTPRQYNKLCETIGICLDNALSATEKSKEKILQVLILENENSIVIKIINTFDNSLEIDKLGTMDYSTKKDGHGLGLYSLLRRKEVIVKTSIINNLFENQITIKKQIKTSNY